MKLRLDLAAVTGGTPELASRPIFAPLPSPAQCACVHRSGPGAFPIRAPPRSMCLRPPAAVV